MGGKDKPLFMVTLSKAKFAINHPHPIGGIRRNKLLSGRKETIEQLFQNLSSDPLTVAGRIKGLMMDWALFC